MAAVESKGQGTQIQAKSRAVANKTLESARNMVTLTEESKEAGIQTILDLDRQGEQLDNIEKGVDTVHADMQQADKSLKEMEKWCGLCILPWKRPKKTNNDVWSGKKDSKVVNSQPQRMMSNEQDGCRPMTGFISRITNDSIEDEMEDCMMKVSSNVGNLRHMALDLNFEINGQVEQLNRITDKTDDDVETLKVANDRAHNVMKS